MRLKLRHYEYNQIIDNIAMLQPRIDPLAALPPELWIPILCEALDQASCGSHNFSNEGFNTRIPKMAETDHGRTNSVVMHSH